MAVLSKNILESLCLVHCCENSPGTSCLSFGGCASVQKLTAYCHAPPRFYTPTPSSSTPPVVLSHALLHLHAHLGPSSPSFRPPRAPPARWTRSNDPPTGPHTKYTRFFSRPLRRRQHRPPPLQTTDGRPPRQDPFGYIPPSSFPSAHSRFPQSSTLTHAQNAFLYLPTFSPKKEDDA